MTMTMSVEMPDTFSIELRSLLTGLLQRDVNKRLGCRGRGAEEIKSHPFFRGIDWRVVYLQRLSPPLIPARGEVNAADAFDIGSFDDEDTKHIKLNEADQELYRNFPVVVSERWQHEIAETIFDYINHEADKVEMKRKNKQQKFGAFRDEEEHSDCILHGYIKRLGGTFSATWLTRYVRLYPNRLELWSDTGKQPELIFMDQIEEVCEDFVQIKNEQCIVIKLYNHSKYVLTNSDEIGLKEWHVSLKAAHKDSMDMMTTMAEKATKIYGTEIPVKHMGKRRQQLQQLENANASANTVSATSGSNISTASGATGTHWEQKIIQKELQVASSSASAKRAAAAAAASSSGHTHRVGSGDKSPLACTASQHKSSPSNRAPSAATTVVHKHHRHAHRSHHHRHHHHSEHGTGVRHHHHRHSHHSRTVSSRVTSAAATHAATSPALEEGFRHTTEKAERRQAEVACEQVSVAGGDQVEAEEPAKEMIKSRLDATVELKTDEITAAEPIKVPPMVTESVGAESQTEVRTINNNNNNNNNPKAAVGVDQTSAGTIDEQLSRKLRDDSTSGNEPDSSDASKRKSADTSNVAAVTAATLGQEEAIVSGVPRDQSSSSLGSAASGSGSSEESCSGSSANSAGATAAAGDSRNKAQVDTLQLARNDVQMAKTTTTSVPEIDIPIEPAAATAAAATATTNVTQTAASDDATSGPIKLSFSLENVNEQQEVLRDPSKRITSDNKQRELDLVAQYEKLNIGARQSSSSIEDDNEPASCGGSNNNKPRTSADHTTSGDRSSNNNS